MVSPIAAADSSDTDPGDEPTNPNIQPGKFIRFKENPVQLLQHLEELNVPFEVFLDSGTNDFSESVIVAGIPDQQVKQALAVVRLNYIKKNNRFRRNKDPFRLPQGQRTYSRVNYKALSSSQISSPFMRASTQPGSKPNATKSLDINKDAQIAALQN